MSEIKDIKRIVIKVGSSIISDGNALAQGQIENLCAFIAKLRTKFEVILVSSGAVVSGYTQLKIDKSFIENKQVLASIGQPLLMEAYRNALKAHNIIPAQLLVMGFIFDSIKRSSYAKRTIETLLANKILPIINENDVLTQGEMMFLDNFGDNDNLGASVTHLANADMLVILSDIYGYFDKNPLENQDARLIKNVRAIRAECLNAEQKGGSYFSTGGIVTKLNAADFLLKKGRKMFLCSGFDLNPTLDFLLNGKHEKGTLFSTESGEII